MNPRNRSHRAPLLALSALATAAVLTSCSSGSDSPRPTPSPTVAPPAPASVAPSVPDAATAKSFSADAGSKPLSQVNAGLDALAKLPGVTGASRSGKVVRVDLAPTATPEQRDAALRLLAGIGEVVTAKPSASPSAKVTTRTPTRKPSVTPSR